MADVFISYSRNDRAFVERLAATLDSLGLSVWWDKKIETGSDWELRIEEELDAAKAVIVVWSSSSVKSQAVRAEARRALRQEKMLPVSAEPVEPPLFSSGIQFEDLSDWSGDTAAVEFQDLFAQIVAMTGGVAAASHVPRDGVTQIASLDETELDAPILEAPWLNRPLGPFRNAATLIWGLIIVGFSVIMAVWREDFFGPYWEGVFLLAGTALFLFLLGERELQPNVKAMIARWLQPQPDAKPLRSTTAFLALFEAVFSKRHFTFRCLWASSVASVGLYAALLMLFIPMEVLEPLVMDLMENGPRPPDPVQIVDSTYVTTGFLAQNAALLFLAVPIANIVVDYFSLWQTRMILRWSANGGPIAVAVVLDAILTAAIFVALLPLGPVAFVLGLAAIGDGIDENTIATARQVAEEIWRSLYVFVTVGWPGEFLSAVAGEANVPNTALLIAFFTTFTTSAWLWFALIFAPLVRFFSWSRRRGLSLFGMAVNTRQRPIAPLGYAAAGLILIVGAVSAEVADALAPKAIGREPEPFEVFRDCTLCPEMVALPGGTIVMGAPEDEVGRQPYFASYRIEEGPLTEVTVAPFSIGRFEVTFREWDACVEATKDLPEGQRCRAIPRGAERAEMLVGGRNYALAFGDQGWGRGLRPVISISWEDAKIFAAWLNSMVEDDRVVYRLASEAEWEYAARAGAQTAFPFEGDPNEVGCAYMNGGDQSTVGINEDWARTYASCDDGFEFTAPKGSFRPNAFGVYDMHGNVWEWVEDCFTNNYVGRGPTGEPWAQNCGSVATLRGGGWSNPPNQLRSASRYGFNRDFRDINVGFRIARGLR